MAEAEDRRPLQSKHKAINTLLPYAVRQERDGRPETLDLFLHAARSSRMLRFGWYRTIQFATTLLPRASSRAIILASPHAQWYLLKFELDSVQWWSRAISDVPYTEEFGQNVVDTLLQIAEQDGVAPHIPLDVWSWLTKQPALPPVCLGRNVGTRVRVVEAVRGLRDIEVLKSYFLLVWSEWDDVRDNNSLDQMCASIREDFGGVGMAPQRAELIGRLDHVLGELDRGLEYLKQYNPRLGKYGLWRRKRRYRKLREALLEVDRRTSSPMTTLLPILILL